VRHPGAVAAVAAGLFMAGGGLTGLVLASHSGYVPPAVAAASPVAAPHRHAAQTQPLLSAAARAAPPVALTIPAIGIRTRLIRLGLTASGALEVPPTTAVAGWYSGSPLPGAIGSAVIAGHVDSRSGSGVFFRLHLLRPHDQIYVTEADGTVAVFRVNVVRSYPKTQFPTGAVYGPTPDAQLRVITCGGSFDPALGSYLSNVVVYATLVK
jgi:sortase (surface protein transpeptidase)